MLVLRDNYLILLKWNDYLIIVKEVHECLLVWSTREHKLFVRVEVKVQKQTEDWARLFQQDTFIHGYFLAPERDGLFCFY